MPLRDHFRPPVSNSSSWEAVHGGCPMVIVQQLVQRLPDRYVAEPRVHLGQFAEVDIAAFDIDDGTSNSSDFSEVDQGGAATAVWAPADPTLAVETHLGDFDEYEVRVYDMRRGRRLVATIELISPGNEDRPQQRQQFTAKCAALLRQGVSVVLVDIVTVREANFYTELLDLIGESDPALGHPPPPTYAAACRPRTWENGYRLEVWHQTLSVGQALPCLPLWLAEDLAVPLDLEASYEQTCRDLRISA